MARPSASRTRAHRALPGLPRMRDGLPFGREVWPPGRSRARRNRDQHPPALDCSLAPISGLPKTTAVQLNLGIVGARSICTRPAVLQRLVRMLGFLPNRMREIESLAPEVETPFSFPITAKSCRPRASDTIVSRSWAAASPTSASRGSMKLRFACSRKTAARFRFPTRKPVVARCTCMPDFRRGSQAGAAQYRCVAGRRLRRDHHERRRLRIDVEGVRRTSGARSGLRRQSACVSRAGQRRERIPGVHRAESRICARCRSPSTYQDSCHLAHGQKVRSAPRKLLQSIPGLQLKEMPLSDLCCGSAGIYNVVHTDMAHGAAREKDGFRELDRRASDRHGQSRLHAAASAGVRKFGRGQRSST